MDSGYQGGGTLGGKLGCALSALVGLPLFGGTLIVASMGQCAPDVECWADWQMFAGAAAITTIVGVTSRAVINTIYRRWRSGR